MSTAQTQRDIDVWTVIEYATVEGYEDARPAPIWFASMEDAIETCDVHEQMYHDDSDEMVVLEWEQMANDGLYEAKGLFSRYEVRRLTPASRG